MVPPKAKAFNFFSFPTRSNVSACYSKEGKENGRAKIHRGIFGREMEIMALNTAYKCCKIAV